VLANTSRRLQTRLSSLLELHRFDLIQVEELYVAANVRKILSRVPVVLDAHNSETLILERVHAAERNSLKRLFFAVQARQMACFENFIARSVSAVFAVSAEEQAHFSKLNPRVHLVPNGVEPGKLGSSRESRMVFLQARWSIRLMSRACAFSSSTFGRWCAAVMLS